tara:strand:+ start:925 stop:1164 length:240 start_codon:yes stop_codon:yes gene_type:complete
MIYSNEVIRRNVRVRELLNEIGHYKQRGKYFHPYINWSKIPSHTIKELIELEVIDLGRQRFLRTPMGDRERNLLIHRRN